MKKKFPEQTQAIKLPIHLVGGVSALLVVLFIGLILLSTSMYTVKTGSKDIVFSGGKATSVSDEGFHFKIPLYQRTKTINIRTREAKKQSSAASNDMQSVSTSVSVNYRFDDLKLIEIQKATGFDIAETIIAPRIEETLKAVSANYSAEQLISQRTKVKMEIDETLKKLLKEYHVIVEGVQVTDFKFSAEFNNAIESKQTEVQETLKAKNVLERRRIEGEQAVVTATAEAEKIRIQANAIKSQGGAEYVQLKMIEKWDGKLPQVTGGDSTMLINPTSLGAN